MYQLPPQMMNTIKHQILSIPFIGLHVFFPPLSLTLSHLLVSSSSLALSFSNIPSLYLNPPPQKRSSCSNHFLSSNSFPELSELSYTSWRCNYCDAQIQLHPTKPSFVLKVDRVIHCAVVGPLSDARHKRDVIIFHDKRGQERDPNWPVLGGLLVVTL